MKNSILCSSVAALSLLAVSSAFAGDYNSGIVTKTPSVEQTPVEFGSGWYIRGDISYNLGGQHEVSSQYIPSLGQTVVADYDDVIGYKVGFGYTFNPAFRMDLTGEASFDSEFGSVHGVNLTGSLEVTDAVTGLVSYVPVANISGVETVEANYNSTNLMVNGYFDLPTIGRFTPYLGAGIGLARVEYNERRTVSCIPRPQETCSDGVVAGALGAQVDDVVVVNAEETSFTHAYQIHAGTAYALSDTLSLDVGYSYFATGDGPEINYTDGTAIDIDGYSVHKLNMGLRYELW